MHTESAIVQPTPERMRHNGILPAEHQIPDSEGRPGAPFKVIDTIARMAEDGDIEPHHISAAFAYMDDFDAGNLHPLRASQFEIQGKGREDLSNRVVKARARIYRAQKALCGLGSPIERAAWNILGMRKSFTEWCANEGNRFTRATAKQLLIEALQVLAHLYGFEKSSISHIIVKYHPLRAIRRGRQRSRLLANVA